MIITYENVIPSLIPNTTMKKGIADGIHRIYEIKAEEGYVLHDNRIDETEYDTETLTPTGNVIPRFKSGSTSIGADYDFSEATNGTYTYIDENNMEITIPVVKIGMYDFYTLPKKNIVI